MLKEVKGTYCESCIYSEGIEIIFDDEGRAYECDNEVRVRTTEELDDECIYYKEIENV